MEEFYKRLKDLRCQMGLSIDDLSNYLDVSSDFISSLESGDSMMDTTVLNDLCDLYGCDYSYILGESDDFSPASIAFRCDDVESLDLSAIAVVNRVRSDLRFLKNLRM